MTHYRATFVMDGRRHEIELESRTNHHSGKMSTILELIDEEIEMVKIQYNSMAAEYKVNKIEYSQNGIHWSEIPQKEFLKTD